jgi:hypothetical protein
MAGISFAGRFGFIVAVFSLHLCNMLIIKELQKAVFWLAKGGLLDGKRWPFVFRFTVF